MSYYAVKYLDAAGYVVSYGYVAADAGHASGDMISDNIRVDYLADRAEAAREMNIDQMQHNLARGYYYIDGIAYPPERYKHRRRA